MGIARDRALTHISNVYGVGYQWIVEMGIARDRALTHPPYLRLICIVIVEMGIARDRALTHFHLTDLSYSNPPVEMGIARDRALTHPALYP